MDKKDAYGNTSFMVEFDNGDKGFFTSKDENQTKFTVGQKVEYIATEKEGKNGKKYFKITLPQFEKNFQGKPAQEPRIQMISFSMYYTKDLVVSGKVGIQEIEKYFDLIYNKMISKL